MAEKQLIIPDWHPLLNWVLFASRKLILFLSEKLLFLIKFHIILIEETKTNQNYVVLVVITNAILSDTNGRTWINKLILKLLNWILSKVKEYDL